MLVARSRPSRDSAVHALAEVTRLGAGHAPVGTGFPADQAGTRGACTPEANEGRKWPGAPGRGNTRASCPRTRRPCPTLGRMYGTPPAAELAGSAETDADGSRWLRCGERFDVLRVPERRPVGAAPADRLRPARAASRAGRLGGAGRVTAGGVPVLRRTGRQGGPARAARVAGLGRHRPGAVRLRRGRASRSRPVGCTIRTARRPRSSHCSRRSPSAVRAGCCARRCRGRAGTVESRERPECRAARLFNK